MKPRIRSIKPEVHLDEVLWDLEQETGLPIFRAFTGMWNMADREGRFEWRPRALKAAILPYWEGDFSRVLDALATRGFVVRYAVDGREYGVVRTFSKHQAINNKEPASSLPAPPNQPPEMTNESTRDARVTNASPAPLGKARVERKGTEGNGGEGDDACASGSPSSPPPEPPDPTAIPDDACARFASDWLNQIFARKYEIHGKWRPSLIAIWRRPAAERERVEATLRASASLSADPGIAKPQHVADYWDDYAAGREPGQFERRTRLAEQPTGAAYQEFKG